MLAGVTALLVTGGSAAARPAACRLFAQQLAEGYFGTDLTPATEEPDSCGHQSVVPGLYRGGDLTLVTWRLRSNARAAIDGICAQPGLTRLRLPGASKACGFQGFTGLCIDLPSGTDCQWDVKIVFRRGRTTGSLELAALQSFTPNDLDAGARLARRVLGRWR
ncbi:MAG TPA: hypothetical protein VKW76_04865 [Candidatus Binatia bacterium]|nr:hypothetical protein [Candidatus Binatia bacterium]